MQFFSIWFSKNLKAAKKFLKQQRTIFLQEWTEFEIQMCELKSVYKYHPLFYYKHNKYNNKSLDRFTWRYLFYIEQKQKPVELI